jgi:hypothetical protein
MEEDLRESEKRLKQYADYLEILLRNDLLSYV